MRIIAAAIAVPFVVGILSSSAHAQLTPELKRALADCDNKQNWDTRIAGCTRSLNLFKKWPPKVLGVLYMQRGQGHQHKNEFEKAIADFDLALKYDSSSAMIHAERSNNFRLSGDYDRSIQAATEAIKRDAKYGLAYINRADAYFKKGDLERGFTDFDAATRMGADVAPRGFLGRANILIRKGEIDRAIEDVDRALQIDPKSAQAYAVRCSAWQEKKEFRNAIADCNRLVELTVTSAAYHDRGQAYFKAGELDQALADFNRSIELDSNNAGAHTQRGDLWRAKGDFKRALADFERAIYVRPNIARAYTARGLAHESNGDYARAKADFETALKLPTQVVVRGAQGLYTEESSREQQAAKARLAALGDAAAPPASPAGSGSTETGRRIALVIGNGAYSGAASLANPANDARTISKNLRRIGFEVSEGVDLDRARMSELINQFMRGATNARIAVLFYAGHGVQIDGKNFLLPIDAKLDGSGDLEGEMTDVNTILAGLDDRIRTNIVILDACRDNPMAQKVQQVANAGASRSVKVRSGLAAPSGLGAGATLGAGTLLAFATAPGQVALDGDGENSPFSSALARHIGTPGLEVQQMLTRVRAEVVAATKNGQVPWSNSSLLGEVYLVGGKP